MQMFLLLWLLNLSPVSVVRVWGAQVLSALHSC